ncbi:esterase [Trabulsiella odontotermitis]|uniref:esterase n=1 Tax=Trabulsiella odontotermitis TaxID=379893 RepID=UPI000675C745|nr:esterase [Trabulsiella odontotermitis]KNC90935.1 esterase [Trabulsiella odontotermitis]
MIQLETRTLAGGEILHAFPQHSAMEALPCIVFYHGFTSSKLVYSYFAVALAQAGFRVIMPDAAEHGARFNGDEQGRMARFWPILMQNFHEFPALRDALIAEGWVSEGRLAVAGASMGGMTALGIMTHHPDVACVASLMGSGYFSSLSRTLFPSTDGWTPQAQQQLAEWDVTHHLDTLASRPLLLWHGEDDDVVPAGESFRLQQALIRQGLDTRLTCAWQANVRHRITPEALTCAVDFFKKHL